MLTSTSTPGVSANALRKNGAVRDARRMRGLETAADMIGGKTALADALGISPRHLTQKLSAERPITDAEVLLAAGAVSARARKADELAARLSALISGPIA
jgi:hypothetical protein